MIEAMEQQLINAINFRFKKNKKLRVDIDVKHVSNCLRMICSSRNSTLSIIDNIKTYGINDDNLNKLQDNVNHIYSWITKESIESLYKKYRLPLKNKKLEQANLEELENIKCELPIIQSTIVNSTIENLLIFHKIKKEAV
ncbi:hypothetical protein [uncultured Clostridium sp.]|uniref:hypothetical protein n=1 Tax=uncultured Clostridium sp. TaxID=59620 RepID=UPI0026040D28|nr:hypothetical protein [uncultured Clostridium sp.]